MNYSFELNCKINNEVKKSITYYLKYHLNKIDVEFSDSALLIKCENNINYEQLNSYVKIALDKFKNILKKNSKNVPIFEFIPSLSNNQFYSYSTNIIDMGLISFTENYFTVFRSLDHFICKELQKLETKNIRQPSLIPMKNAIELGVFDKSIHNLHFVSQENLHSQNCSSEKNMFILSPAACLHSYYLLKNCSIHSNQIYSNLGLVFRNEGNNFNQFERLREFHQREFTYIGDDIKVSEFKRHIISFYKKLMRLINVESRIVYATDIFIGENSENFLYSQLIKNNKLELEFLSPNSKYVSVSSYNYHDNYFTKRMNITLANNYKCISACCGFGLERLVHILLSRYGDDFEKWPINIVKKLKLKNFQN